MDDFVNQDLLARNILEGLFGDTSSSAPDIPEADMYGLSPLESIFQQPRTQALDALQAHLQAMPQRTEPSMLRRIMGGLASMAATGPGTYYHGQPIGIQTDPLAAQKISYGVANRPHLERMQDWERKLEPLEKMAEIEGRRGNWERLRESSIYNAQTRRQEVRRKEKYDEARVEDMEKRRKISQQRANAYDWSKRNPNRKMEEDKDGFLFTRNPETNQAEYVYDAEGEPIKGIHLTPQMRKDLKLGEIEARKKADLEVVAARAAEARKTKQTVPGVNPLSRSGRTPAGAKPESEASKQKRRVNRANQALLEHPEWKDIITINSGIVTVREPSGWSSAAKKKMAKDARDYMLAGETSGTTEAGRVSLLDPNGKEFTLPKEQVDAFLKSPQGKGYKVK